MISSSRKLQPKRYTKEDISLSGALLCFKDKFITALILSFEWGEKYNNIRPDWLYGVIIKDKLVVFDEIINRVELVYDISSKEAKEALECSACRLSVAPLSIYEENLSTLESHLEEQ